MVTSAQKLRLTILTSFIVIACLLNAPITFMTLNAMQETLLREKLNHLASLSSSRAHQIERLLDVWIEQIDLISSRTQLRILSAELSTDNATSDQKKLTRIIQDAKSSAPKIRRISILNANGKIISSTSPEKLNQTMTNQNEFILGKKQGRVHDIKIENNLPLISVTSPMYLNNKFIGIVWSELIITDLYVIAYDNTGLGKTGEILIAGKTREDGAMMLAPSRANQSIAFNKPFANRHAELINKITNARKRVVSSRSFQDYRGVPVLAAYKPIAQKNWGVMAKMDLTEINGPIIATQNHIILIFLAGLAPLIALSIWLSSKITHSVRNAEAKTNTIIEAAGDAIILLDKAGRVTKINNAASHLFNGHQEQIVGQPIVNFAPLEKRSQYRKIIQALCSDSRKFDVGQTELEAITLKNKKIPIEITISQPPPMSKTKLIMICRDSSKRREAENQIRAALSQQTRLLEAQKQFVSIASHEFRTPLSIISNSVQHIERAGDHLTTEYLHSKTANIRMAVGRMLHLLQSTLSLSTMEQGKFQLHVQNVNLKRLLHQVSANHQDISTQHKIHLDIGDLPDTIQIDPIAIEQTLNNLINNAIKYSPEAGKVDITARQENQSVLVSVQDYGLGIESKDLPNLFDRFFRAENSIGIAGAGIGLHLVKLFAEMHHGTISVTSKPTLGSTFTLELPIAGPSEKEQDKSDAA